ncbi:transposase, partial [Akkermansiaceae bacterium]|nr:transposase [Akkermansiaceae bacterium]
MSSRASASPTFRFAHLYAKLTPDQRHALSPRQNWNVQLQPVGSGKTALRYLARYVQRSAFSAKRTLGYDPSGKILLKWTDSTTKKTSVLKLHPHEFIRRWCLHVLPKGFMRVRHYGLAAGAAKKNRHLLRRLLGQVP